MGLAAGLVELLGVSTAILGVFVAWGPYQDEHTQNLMRNRARSEAIEVPAAEPTHFQLRELFPMADDFKSPVEEERKRLGLAAYRRKAPPVLFLHGHCGKWVQVINIAVYMNILANSSSRAAFFSADFHASVSALHVSVLQQQAAFAAASMLRIAELYEEVGVEDQALTVIGHSMGGLVALEALRLLDGPRAAGKVKVGAVILVSTPLLGHPLLLEQGMHSFATRLRRELWPTPAAGGSRRGLNMPVLALAAGDTDPLVPSEVVRLPSGEPGFSLLTPAVHNIYSSFSHVNLIFARHFLHTFVKFVSAAVHGKLGLAVQKHGDSPLRQLFFRSRVEAVAAVQPDDRWRVARRGPSGKLVPEEFTLQALLQVDADAPGRFPSWIAWDELEVGGTTVLGRAPSSVVFTLALFERPRPITRDIEDTTKGEDFDGDDMISCKRLVRVDFLVLTEGGVLTATEIAPMVLQYPVKACVFHFAVPTTLPDVSSVAAAVTRLRTSRMQLAGWAQWHGDPLAAPGGDAVGSVKAVFSTGIYGWWSWACSVLRPRRLRLPAGRSALARLAAPLAVPPRHHSWAPLLPLDFRVAADSGSAASTPWGLRAIMIAADAGADTVFVGALHDGPGRSWSWAAESAVGVFAPRFVPGLGGASSGVGADASVVAAGEAPLFLLLSDPTIELEVEVRGNFLSMLARLFRTYLGYIMGSWMGATLVLHRVLLGDRQQAVSSLSTWAAASVFLALLFSQEASTKAAGGFVPGTPPAEVLVIIHMLGLFLATTSRRVLSGVDFLTFRLTRCCVCRCCSGSRPLLAFFFEFSLWAAAAAVHPALCVLLMNLRAVTLRLALRERRLQGSEDRLGGSLCAGFAAVLGLYLLSYLPSLIFLIWVLQGQHREASSKQEEPRLLAALLTSRDAPSPLADSWLFHGQAVASLSPFLGLLPPAVVLGCQAAVVAAAPRAVARSGATLTGGTMSQPAAVAAAPAGLAAVHVASRWFCSMCAPFVVAFVGHRTHCLWYCCLFALCGHAVVALAEVLHLHVSLHSVKLE